MAEDPPPQANPVMPIVARPPAGPPLWLAATLLLLLGVLVFTYLTVRRERLEAPATRYTDSPAILPQTSAPPPLVLPPEPVPQVAPSPIAVAVPEVVTVPTRVVRTAPQRPLITYPPPPTAPRQRQMITPIRNAPGPALVVDYSASPNSPAPAATPEASVRSPVGSTERARASFLANRSSTVAQGAMLPAVLETGFNSTRAGFARALISRNVMSFDGSKVLIPRGSRLIGEYQADVTSGQKRALIIWTRLLRADGVTIALVSPGTDTVGQNGIKAHAHTHFLERFGSAILQSVLDVGVNLASRPANAPVLVALPSSGQAGMGELFRPDAVPPTLTIKPGKSISIFVARDLDFSDVQTAE